MRERLCRSAFQFGWKRQHVGVTYLVLYFVVDAGCRRLFSDLPRAGGILPFVDGRCLQILPDPYTGRPLRKVFRVQLEVDGDRDSAETVRDHLRRLRALAGEAEPAQGIQKWILEWEEQRETWHSRVMSYKQQGCTSLLERTTQQIAKADQHLIRLKKLASYGG